MSTRNWPRILTVAGLVAAVYAAVVLVALSWPQEAPPISEAERAVPGTLLHYQEKGVTGSNEVLFLDNQRIYLDRLVLDRSLYLAPLPHPRWRLTGDWDYALATADPASCAVLMTGESAIVFGAAHSPQIASVRLPAPEGGAGGTTSLLSDRGFVAQVPSLGPGIRCQWFDAGGALMFESEARRALR